MKRIAVIFFFLVYTLTTTEAKQLLKLPVLFEHFAEHKQGDDSISFLDFVYMHYIGSDFDDGDQDRDMQLPFKSATFMVLEANAFAPVATKLASDPVVSVKDKLVFARDVSFQSSDLSSIWQPPKLA